MATQNFLQKNQVLITAIAGALTLSLQQFIGQSELDYKVLGLAALIAVAGVIGNHFRGKGVSVLGFIGVVGTAFTTIQQTGSFSWNQFGLAVVVGFLAVIAPPAKSEAYEKSETIKVAKAEAKVITAEEKKSV